jgi:hypothetical protein
LPKRAIRQGNSPLRRIERISVANARLLPRDIEATLTRGCRYSARVIFYSDRVTIFCLCRGMDANSVDFSDHFFSSHGAMAETRTVIAGKPFKLFSAVSTNPDCSAAGDIVIRVVSPPSNGRVSIARGGVFPSFPPSNVRSECNRRRVPGTIAIYTAQRGYTGPDSVSLEVIYPSGHVRQGSYSLMVR